jgi:hypothetical protein
MVRGNRNYLCSHRNYSRVEKKNNQAITMEFEKGSVGELGSTIGYLQEIFLSQIEETDQIKYISSSRIK